MLSPDAKTRAQALQDYSQANPMPDETLIADLLNDIQTGPFETRAYALTALGHLGQNISEAAREKLIAVLLASYAAKDALVQCAALKATGQLKIDSLRPFVEKAALDTQPSVQAAAAGTLAILDPLPTVPATPLVPAPVIPVATPPVAPPAVVSPVPSSATHAVPMPLQSSAPAAVPLPPVLQTPPQISSPAVQQVPSASIQEKDVYDGPFLKDAWAKEAYEKQKAEQQAALKAKEQEEFCRNNPTTIGCPGYVTPLPAR